MGADISGLSVYEREKIVRDYDEAHRQFTIYSENGPWALFAAAGWVAVGLALWSHQPAREVIPLTAVTGFLSRNALDYFKARRAFSQIHERWHRKGVDLSSAHLEITSANPPSTD